GLAKRSGVGDRIEIDVQRDRERGDADATSDEGCDRWRRPAAVPSVAPKRGRVRRKRGRHDAVLLSGTNDDLLLHTGSSFRLEAKPMHTRIDRDRFAIERIGGHLSVDAHRRGDDVTTDAILGGGHDRRERTEDLAHPSGTVLLNQLRAFGPAADGELL